MAVQIPMGYADIRPEDIAAVSDVLASSELRQGRVVSEFERSFAARVGANHAVAVSSGTAALHLSYLALFCPGDEVIVPAFTFVATASMLLAIGAVPVFADVDPRTFTLAVDDVRSRITDRTRGIAGVHLFGNACDVDALLHLSRENGLKVVWDAAQALGTKYAGRDIGGYPDAVCYSFYPTKNITTGEGGMVVTDDPDLAALLRLTRSQGAKEKYHHTVVGFNYRMTEFQAALGVRQLARLDEYLRSRQKNAERLNEWLTSVGGIAAPSVTDNAIHSYNQYCVLVSANEAGLDRDQLQRHLSKLGIATAVHYPVPLHRQPIFHGTGQRLSTAERLCGEILAVPIHPGLSDTHVERIGEALVGAASANVAL